MNGLFVKKVVVMYQSFEFTADYLTSSKWILTANKEQLNPPNIHGATSSDRPFTRWKLNNTTSSLRLILQSENFWLCNVTIHALPGELKLGTMFKQNLTRSFSFRWLWSAWSPSARSHQLDQVWSCLFLRFRISTGWRCYKKLRWGKMVWRWTNL